MWVWVCARRGRGGGTPLAKFPLRSDLRRGMHLFALAARTDRDVILALVFGVGPVDLDVDIGCTVTHDQFLQGWRGGKAKAEDTRPSQGWDDVHGDAGRDGEGTNVG